MTTCLFESLKIHDEQVESDIQLGSLSDLQNHIFLVYDGYKHKFSPAEREYSQKTKGTCKKDFKAKFHFPLSTPQHIIVRF